MADAVGGVTKVVELALKIKEAVDTVRQNRKDCAYLKRRAERVHRTVSLCEGNAELMESPAVRDAVEALGEVLGEALELVTACQEETNAVCLCCTAGKLSKQLGKIDRAISDGNSEATFAILVYHISKQAGHGAGPATIPTKEIPQQIVVDEQWRSQTNGGAGAGAILIDGRQLLPQKIILLSTTFKLICKQSFRTSRGTCPGSPGAGSATVDEAPEQTPQSSFTEQTWISFPRWASFAADISDAEDDYACGLSAWDAEDDYGGDGALLQDIARVTLAIRTALETVRRNKEECVEIEKRASRASVLLSQLEEKETTRDTAVRGALESLLRTFRRAHELVEACQRWSFLVLCSRGNLSRQSSDLRQVLDDIMLDLDHLIDVLV